MVRGTPCSCRWDEDREPPKRTFVCRWHEEQETQLERAIDMLCGATSGFHPGTMKDVKWQSDKDALLREYANRLLRARTVNGPK